MDVSRSPAHGTCIECLYRSNGGGDCPWRTDCPRRRPAAQSTAYGRHRLGESSTALSYRVDGLRCRRQRADDVHAFCDWHIISLSAALFRPPLCTDERTGTTSRSCVCCFCVYQ